MTRPRFGSLFSGVGGVDRGLEDAGWECAFQVENDPYCTAVLEKHWPGVPRYTDIREVDWNEVATVDLLAGGYPCQPVSYAGRGKAQEDERWLWPEFARAIGVLRPRLILVENVPGLRGRGLDIVLGDLATLGYDAEWHTVPASALGAPHRRDRLWVVAYPQRIGGPGRGEAGYVAGETGAPEDHREQRERGGYAAHHRGPVVAYADPPRLEEWMQPLLLGQRPTPVRDGWGAAQSGVGREANGIPTGLDRVAPWEGDTPRTTTTKPPYRVARLKALGNAVVPVCAEWIGRQLLEVP